nr:hypothetical protein BaRGS_022105 [Batillaria attramentaria]
MSIVSVWTHSKPRVEVRTQGQAVSEVGRRVSDIVLLPSQAALLADPTLTRLCLTGPMGSGKTLMLQLKGRQWARQGKRVVILNVRTSGKGRPVGHLLEKAIKHNIDVGCETNTGSVERHDVAIKEFDLKVFKETPEKDGLLDSLCFILDELTNLTLLEQLANEYPDSPIWSVVMYLREPPQNFKHRMLKSVLRCPPSVQLMLKELDLNPLHKDNAYTTRSTARGLPCDGPPIIFIQHRKHDTKARPLDCSDCAQELDDILLNKLGLKSLLASPAEGCATSQASAQEVPKRTAAADLSFRDVLLLVCMPLAYYKPGGPDLWEASMKDAHKFYQYVTASKFFKGLLKSGLPLNPVTDNTSREIACPSDDKIVITEIMGVQSIERKVVFFLPGGPPFDTLGSGLTAESGASAETRSYPERPDDDTHTAEELQQLLEK